MTVGSQLTSTDKPRTSARGFETVFGGRGRSRPGVTRKRRGPSWARLSARRADRGLVARWEQEVKRYDPMFDDATTPDDDASDQPVDDVVNDSDASADVGQEPEAEEPEAEEPEAEDEEDDESRLQWFVLKVTTNREKSIRQSLLRRIAREGLDEFFTEVIIPTENVVETKAGKKKVSEQKLFPGYLFVQMVLNDETWYLVRGTSGIGDFTGAGGKPVAMSDEEVSRMLGKEEEKEAEPARIKIDFSAGDVVKIKDGPFESFEGEIDEIDEASGKISVLIEIFGRHTPAELEYWQVEKV